MPKQVRKRSRASTMPIPDFVPVLQAACPASGSSCAGLLSSTAIARENEKILENTGLAEHSGRQCTLLGTCTGWRCWCFALPTEGLSLASSPSLLPRDDPLGRFGSQYLVASYVKWIEQAGARVVPVKYNQSDADLSHLFRGLFGAV